MRKRKPRRVAEVKAPPAARNPGWLPVAALAALAFAVYANSLGNGFIGDDQFQLLRNPLVKDFSAIPRIFTGGVWSFLGVTANYYRPLPFVIYSLIYHCAGFQAWAFHLFMVLLHAMNAVLVFLLLRRMASGRIAWAAGALFAVHPAHTEAVDWIASLPDLALTSLALTGLLLFARQNGEPRPRQIAVHCAIFLAALWTKETGIALAALYPGFGFSCLGRRWSELRRNAALYAAMAVTLAAYLGMRFHALGSFAPRKQDFFHLTPLEFALSAVVTAAQYLQMLFVPANLNYFHVFHPTQTVTFGFSISAAALACAAAVFLRSKVPLLTYGLFWMGVAIAPALDLTAVGQNVFAERYLYLPSVAFCWMAAWAWLWLEKRYRALAAAAAAALLLVCAFGVAVRNRDWHDNFTMLQVTEAQSPDSGWVHDALAGELVNRNQFARALEEERLAVNYDPRMALYRKKLGYILLGADPRGAAAEFQQANLLEPGVAANHYDLGMALEVEGQRDAAAAEYKKALELQPRFPEAQEAYDRVAPPR